MSENEIKRSGGGGGGLLETYDPTKWYRRVRVHVNQRLVALPPEFLTALQIDRGTVLKMWIEERTIHMEVVEPVVMPPEEEQP